MASMTDELAINLKDRLTVDQKNKVDHLRDIIKDHSEEQCLNLLETNFWNIEASLDSLNLSKSKAVDISSVNSFTALYNRDPISATQVLPSTISNEIEIADSVDRIFQSPIISKEHHPWLFRFFLWTARPLNLAFTTFNFVLKYLFFWKSSEVISQDAMLFYEEQLMELFCASLLVSDPETGSVTLFLGNFEEAVAQAKHEYKFLLVYLHKLGDGKADAFLHNCFLNAEVVELLNDPENILIWTGNLSSHEGQEVLRVLRTNADSNRDIIAYSVNPLSKLFMYPDNPFFFTLLSVSSVNGRLKLTVIGQLEKHISALELKQILKKWIEIGSRPRLTAKREKVSRDAVKNLRYMQDMAFKQVLERDKHEEAKILQERNQEKLLSLRKEELRNELSIYSQSESNIERSVKCFINLLIKMPNGRRFDHQFDAHSSTKFLFFVVFCQEDAPSNFELLWSYPQRILLCKPRCFVPQERILLDSRSDDPPTFISQGISGNQVILVKDLEK